jgi:hypothetical protein
MDTCHLQDSGHTLSPYNSWVANWMIDGAQRTIIWHVDDLKLGHVDIDTLKYEVKWFEYINGTLVEAIGDQHTYLGVDLECKDTFVKISMVSYLQEILDEFTEPLFS